MDQVNIVGGVQAFSQGECRGVEGVGEVLAVQRGREEVGGRVRELFTGVFIRGVASELPQHNNQLRSEYKPETSSVYLPRYNTRS